MFNTPNTMGSYNTSLRNFGSDGWAETDYHWHRPHGGQPTPHAHDWNRTPTGVERQPGWRPVRPGELSSPWTATGARLRNFMTLMSALLRSRMGPLLPIIMVDPCPSGIAGFGSCVPLIT